MKRNTLPLELLLIALIFVASNINSVLRQKQNTYNGGTAWEGAYYVLAQEFASHQPLVADAPYVYRLATPWLVALISPHDLFRGFHLVNIAGSAVASVLLLFWLRGYLSDWRVLVLLVTLFLIQWDAPPRLLYHSPVHADAWLFAFVIADLLLLRRYLVRPSAGCIAGLCVLAAVGAYFREATLFVPLCVLAADRPIVKEGGRWKFRLPPWRLYLPFACGFLAFLSIRLVAHQTNDYSFVQTVYRFLYDKPVLTYIHAWFLAFGPVLFIILFDWRNAVEFLAEEQWLALLLATGAGFGFLGGTDTERLQYWSMPGVYLLLGLAMERHWRILAWWPVTALFAAGQICTSRILWTTPDYPTHFQHTFPVLQQFGSNVQFLDLFSYFGYRPKETLSLAQFIVFGAIVLWLMWHRERRLGLRDTSQALAA
ncbi:MAG TPA: hypothetical protein VGM54_03595 [Chthoniobacter sp.]|jgi:hypothetical protein